MLVLSALLRERPLYSRTLSGASYYVNLLRYAHGSQFSVLFLMVASTHFAFLGP